MSFFKVRNISLNFPNFDQQDFTKNPKFLSMTLLWHNDVICWLNYTKLIRLWFSTTLPNSIAIPWIVLELKVASTFHPTLGPGTPKKPGLDRVKAMSFGFWAYLTWKRVKLCILLGEFGEGFGFHNESVGICLWASVCICQHFCCGSSVVDFEVLKETCVKYRLPYYWKLKKHHNNVLIIRIRFYWHGLLGFTSQSFLMEMLKVF